MESNTINVHFQPEEYALIAQAAALDMRSMSGLCRKGAVEASRKIVKDNKQ